MLMTSDGLCQKYARAKTGWNLTTAEMSSESRQKTTTAESNHQMRTQNR